MIATLAEVKTLLEISSATYDTLLTELLTGISARFDTACNRVLEREVDRVDSHDGGGAVISLALYPVESFTSVKEDLDRDFAGATALTENTDYWCDAKAGLLWREATTWLSGRGIVEVTYTGGYVAAGSSPGAGQTGMPEDLQRAAQLQCRYEFLRRNELGLLQAGTSGSNVHTFSPMGLLPEVGEILSQYRRQDAA